MEENIEKILICKLKFYGDVLLITPVIESIKARYPNSKIDLLLYEETKSIIEENKNINNFYLIKKEKNVPQGIKNYCSIRSKLKREKYDIIINLTEQWPIALLISSLGRFSIAFERKKWYWNKLFTRVTQVQGQHIVVKNLSILKGLGFGDSQLKQELKLSYNKTDYEWLLKQEPSIASQSYVVIQPTSRQLFKCWENEKFAEVIDYLHGKNISVYLTCGPASSELDQVTNIASLCNIKPNLTFAGKTTFLQLAALIDHSMFYIGVDSAPMHMAAALKKNQVCLFGATNPLQWRPWSDKANVIWAGKYHQMPKRHELDRNQRYLKWIPVNAIKDAIDRILKEKKIC